MEPAHGDHRPLVPQQRVCPRAWNKKGGRNVSSCSLGFFKGCSGRVSGAKAGRQAGRRPFKKRFSLVPAWGVHVNGGKR